MTGGQLPLRNRTSAVTNLFCGLLLGKPIVKPACTLYFEDPGSRQDNSYFLEELLADRFQHRKPVANLNLSICDGAFFMFVGGECDLEDLEHIVYVR